MKILITGSTSSQINGTMRLQIMDMSEALRHLSQRHNTVLASPFDPAAQESYDIVFIGLAPLAGISSSYAAGAILRGIRSREREKVVWYVSDGKYPHIMDGFKFDWLFRGRAKALDTRENRLAIEKWHDDVKRGNIGHLLIPTFGGDTLAGAMFTESYARDMVYGLDISSLVVKQFPKLQPETKSKKWVLGALGDYSNWVRKLGLTWPCEMYGKTVRIPEPELVKRYNSAWGVLAPNYPPPSRGKFMRYRYLHAAYTGSVVYTDDNNIYDTAVVDIESMDDRRLAELAAAQKNHLYSFIWSEEELVEKYNNLLGAL